MIDNTNAIRTLRTLFPQSGYPTREEIQEKVDMLASFPMYQGIDKIQIIKEIEEVFGIRADDYAIIQDSDHYKSWLPEKKSQIQWDFWNRYSDYLRIEKNLAPDTLRRVDSLTDDILNRLFDPSVFSPIDKRGLVVGQVQSGKTSNYTGLICKAVDSGFKIIVILAGIHNNLRSQTQLRIDEGFLGFDTQTSRAFNNANKRLGVGRIKADLVAHSLTSSLDKGDFAKGAFNSLGINFNTNEPIILVVKKNTSVLKRLYEWLASNAILERDNNKIIDNKSLLLIDDEADHASINTSKDKITRINERIRSILRLFARSGYVGYTATPFANIFIPIEDDNLFPKDFIVNLPAPSNYIGPEKIFGLSSSNNDNVLPTVHRIDDFSSFAPEGHKKDDVLPSVVPPSLKLAIKSFILVCAIRRARNKKQEHNSMLIHVTRYTRWQHHVKELVEIELSYYQKGIDQNDPSVLEEIRQVFEVDTVDYQSYKTSTIEILDPKWENINASIKSHSWEEVLAHLHDAAAKIVVKTINGGSADALNYFDEPNGVSVIAVGGDKLSRGLTLEGLSVSYYLRASKMYDTLMQMGRWFGYRPGYVDLCRLFTSDEINEWYCHIALASDELRLEFDYMKDVAGTTPKDFALKIRTHPDILQITASNKMRKAVIMNFTFSSHLAQTYLLKKDKESIEDNLLISKDFIEQLGAPEMNDKSKILWRTNDCNQIISFLNSFKVHPNLVKASPQNIVNYIKMQNKEGELIEWVIAIPKIERSDVPPHSFLINGEKTPINLIKRKHQDHVKKDVYFVFRGNLLSPSHEFFDLDNPNPKLTGKQVRESNSLRPSTQALLLLYPLNPVGVTDETDLPIMGVAISFPKSNSGRFIEYATHEQLLDRFNFDEEIEDLDYDNED
jgi:Z1 domain